MQTRLLNANPWLASLDASYAPDGDADLEIDATASVEVPNCTQCDGLLKPDVVFFGENVDRTIVKTAFEHLDEAEGLLVIGSSLMVYSGFRFCRRAHEQNKPIVIVNNGLTRGDEIASAKFEGECGELIENLAELLL